MAPPSLPGRVLWSSSTLEQRQPSVYCPQGPLNQGKSIALSQWAQQTERELVWLHPTPESAHPELFWRQLTMALRSESTIFPEWSN